jgi:MoaA/NifB/PqqE/SkfB family radical SAM enzyme
MGHAVVALPPSEARCRAHVPFGWPLARRFAADALRLRAGLSVSPLVFADFVTFRCNLACGYCGYNRRGLARRYPDLDTSDALRVLDAGRRAAPSLAVSGGEPLVRDDILVLLRHARALGFRPITLFTNGLELPRREAVLDCVDFLQVSLDTLDEAVQDRLNGRPGAGRSVADVVRRYAQEQSRRGFRLHVNAVLGPDTVDGAPAVLEFAARHGVRLSVCPELDDHGQPVPGLLEPAMRARYRAVLDHLLNEGRRRRVLLDTPHVLEHLRDLRPAACQPDLVARVYPDGTVPLPCPPRAVSSPNLLASAGWQGLRAKAGDCGRPCPRPCLVPGPLTATMLVSHPLAILGHRPRDGGRPCPTSASC